ncbi:poly(U)-specific 3'-to-5' RNA exonuclease [Dimargaris xerosporica]|nr:poly(U)-specific 3'-to-5' RNA exonuclease [Dimargaris xerosporica]
MSDDDTVDGPVTAAGALIGAPKNATDRTSLPKKPHQPLRTVPHIEGNWATYVYIKVHLEDELAQYVQQLIYCAQELCPYQILPTSDEPGVYHISLSRLVFVKVYQIDRIVTQLETVAARHSSFNFAFDALQRFTNDERTRSFLALGVGAGHFELNQLAKHVDQVWAGYHFPAFYEPPQFHISVASATHPNAIHDALVDKLRCQPLDTTAHQGLEDILAQESAYTGSDFTFRATHLACTIGNRHYEWPLRFPRA